MGTGSGAKAAKISSETRTAVEAQASESQATNVPVTITLLADSPPVVVIVRELPQTAPAAFPYRGTEKLAMAYSVAHYVPHRRQRRLHRMER